MLGNVSVRPKRTGPSTLKELNVLTGRLDDTRRDVGGIEEEINDCYEGRNELKERLDAAEIRVWELQNVSEK